MDQFTPHIMPLDFRSRNMHNKNNKIDQYNKQFSNNVKIIDQDYRIPIKKQLGENLYNMMLNDEQDITSGCANTYVDTNIFNNYIQHPQIKYTRPDNLFSSYTNNKINNSKQNIYNSIINNNYNINIVTDVEDSKIFNSSKIIPPKIITYPLKYTFKPNSSFNYVDSNFINKVF